MCHKFFFCRTPRLKAHPACWVIFIHEHHHPLHLCASPSTEMEVLVLFYLRIATEYLLCMKEDFFMVKVWSHWHPIKQEWMFPTNYKGSTGPMPHPRKIGGLKFYLWKESLQPGSSVCLFLYAHEGWCPTPHSDKLRNTLGSCSKECGKGLQQQLVLQDWQSLGLTASPHFQSSRGIF